MPWWKLIPWKVVGWATLGGLLVAGYVSPMVKLKVCRAELASQKVLTETWQTRAEHGEDVIGEWKAYGVRQEAKLAAMNEESARRESVYESMSKTSQETIARLYAKNRKLESRPAQTITASDCETAVWQFFSEVGVVE